MTLNVVATGAISALAKLFVTLVNSVLFTFKMCRFVAVLAATNSSALSQIQAVHIIVHQWLSFN